QHARPRGRRRDRAGPARRHHARPRVGRHRAARGHRDLAGRTGRTGRARRPARGTPPRRHRLPLDHGHRRAARPGHAPDGRRARPPRPAALRARGRRGRRAARSARARRRRTQPHRGGCLMALLTTVADLRAARRRRRALVVAGMLLVVLAAGTGALLVGAAGLTPGQAVAGVVGLGVPGDAFVVQRLRLPRRKTAALVGAAFGLAAAPFQSTLLTPLAFADLLGISTGACLGAATVTRLLGQSGVALSATAFSGAGVVAVALWLLAWRKGLLSIRFVLVGVGFAYLCSSLIAWSMARTQEHEAAAVLTWTVG